MDNATDRVRLRAEAQSASHRWACGFTIALASIAMGVPGTLIQVVDVVNVVTGMHHNDRLTGHNWGVILSAGLWGIATILGLLLGVGILCSTPYGPEQAKTILRHLAREEQAETNQEPGETAE